MAGRTSFQLAGSILSGENIVCVATQMDSSFRQWFKRFFQLSLPPHQCMSPRGRLDTCHGQTAWGRKRNVMFLNVGLGTNSSWYLYLIVKTGSDVL